MAFAFRKKPKGNKRPQFVLIHLLPLLNVILLLFLKHFSHHLTFNQINFLYIGNALNVGFWIALEVTVTVLRFYNLPVFEKSLLLVNKMMFAAIFSLVIAGVLQFSGLQLRSIYILGVFGEKILVGFFYVINYTIIVITIFYLWALITKVKNLIWLRTFVNFSILSLLLLMFSFFYSQGFSRSDSQMIRGVSKSEIAVVLGAAVWTGNKPSDILAYRANKAVELYKNGKTKRIQLTGSNAPGELSEAEAAFNYIKNMNVPEKDLYLETETTSTTEQVQFIKNELIDNKQFRSIVVVSERFHLKRIKEIGKFFKVELQLVNSDIKISSQKLIYYKLREGLALLMFWLFAQ